MNRPTLPQLPQSRHVMLAAENARYGDDWVQLELPAGARPAHLTAAWRNRHFLVQIFDDPNGYTRLSVNRTSLLAGRDASWVDGITWDELMAAKAAVGYGDAWCAEAYPPDADVVNVANLRHLFVLPTAPAWAWEKTPPPRTLDHIELDSVSIVDYPLPEWDHPIVVTPKP